MATSAPLSIESGISVRAVANKLQLEVYGDDSIMLSGIKPLEDATENDLSFYSPSARRGRKALREQLARSRAGAVLLPRMEEDVRGAQLITANPTAAIIELIPYFYQTPPFTVGIHPQAVVADSSLIAPGVSIGAFAVIGEGAVIGENTTIHPHVVIYPKARIGKNCVIHAGAVIREQVVVGSDCIIQSGVVLGGDGFGYLPDREQGHRRIPQIGTVILEDSVDLGANTTIDRATFGTTKIGAGTKIDNLVMVGHNVQIGRNVILCAQVGISGSTRLGNQVILAGQVGVADHTEVGDNVRAAGKCGITHDVDPNVDIAGHPCVPAIVWKRRELLIQKLPEMLKRLQRLERGKTGRS